jgi:hypothetical protein
MTNELHEHNLQPQKSLSLPKKSEKVHFTPENYASSSWDLFAIHSRVLSRQLHFQSHGHYKIPVFISN